MAWAWQGAGRVRRPFTASEVLLRPWDQGAFGGHLEVAGLMGAVCSGALEVKERNSWSSSSCQRSAPGACSASAAHLPPALGTAAAGDSGRSPTASKAPELDHR
jgi:hypothetical protein